MIQEIVNGIKKAIGTEFDSAYPVYETVPEEETEPYFLVTCAAFTTSRGLGNRFRRTYGVQVMYYPRDGDSVTECFQMGERLADSLQCITVEERNIFAEGELSGKLVDGKFQLEVSYSVQMMTEETSEERMETLQQTQTIVNY